MRKNNGNIWALQGNPKYYDLIGASRELDFDWWRTGQSDIKKGDRIVFWQSSDANKNRGVVALGIAVSDREERADSTNRFWKVSSEDLQKRESRIRIRYIKIAEPLWMGNTKFHPILDTLTVSRGQGTAFRITETQWDAVLELIEEDLSLSFAEEFKEDLP